jgi:hypothetical protein
MTKSIFFILLLLLSACATFDKTNIKPGHKVVGLGFSFTVPTEKSWFAVEYGTSHRIKLSQLNHQDSYSILVSINRGPFQGMYKSPEAHLQAFKYHKQREFRKVGLIQHNHKEWADSEYGELCVRYTSSSEDWRGRNNAGPAIVDLIGLTCPHPELHNVLVSFDLSRRSETYAEAVDLTHYADVLFSSVEYTSTE